MPFGRLGLGLGLGNGRPAPSGGGDDGGGSTPPSFVNVGAHWSSSSATLMPALPDSRVTGNLLIAVVIVRGAANITTTTPGWTRWAQVDSGGGSAGLVTAIFYCAVDGSETAPTFTTGVGSSNGAEIAQYSGCKTDSPFGASNVASGIQTSPVAVTGITTTEANSLAIYIVGSRNSSSGIDTPAGWTEDWDAAVATRSTGGHKEMSAAGSLTGDLSATCPSILAWNAWIIELLAV